MDGVDCGCAGDFLRLHLPVEETEAMKFIQNLLFQACLLMLVVCLVGFIGGTLMGCLWCIWFEPPRSPLLGQIWATMAVMVIPSLFGCMALEY
jgi:hypothetical protein